MNKQRIAELMGAFSPTTVVVAAANDQQKVQTYEAEIDRLKLENTELKSQGMCDVRNIKHLYTGGQSHAYSAERIDNNLKVVIKSCTNHEVVKAERNIYCILQTASNYSKFIRVLHPECRIPSFGFSLVFSYYDGCL